MRRALLLFVVLLAASIFPATPSRAQFATCDHDYVASFDVDVPGLTWSAGTIECVEFFRIEFETPHGTRWVRGVGDVNLSTMVAPGAIDAARDGARRAVQRFSALGDYEIDNTTILLAFSTGELLTEPPEAQPMAWTVSADAPECHVTLFLLNDWSVDVEIPHSITHELFHCVQEGSLTEAQRATMRGGGAWWGEGTAEMFAGAVIGRPIRWNRAAQFDEAVAEGIPLTRLTSSAAVFFYWLYQRDGLGSIMPFLHAMAESNSEAAQNAALRNVVSEEELLQFAEDYDDREINYPNGGPLAFGARVEGATWRIDATSTQRVPLQPFVITVGWAEYACGRWGNSVNDANAAARNERVVGWGDWPAETDARDGGARYRTVAVHTGAERGELRLRAERRESCTACMAASVIDRCLVGRWRQTGGGPLEYMRSRGVPITRANVDALVITLNDDGTFQSGGANIDVETRTVDHHGHVMESDSEGSVRPSHGRWSAEAGRFSGCFDGGGGASGQTVASAGGYAMTTPFGSADLAGTGGGTSYTCSATTFTTSSPTRYGPMTYTFTRETPPPPE
ncbi:hypothetical protein [Terricaulis sp.]|uniref:hypothetical protein n=1 Tax=Terricaulis sp. TaxID=2768686 RepID=UPI0037835952